jgi:hypothetical protein
MRNRLPHRTHHLLLRRQQQQTLPNHLLPIHQNTEFTAVANHRLGIDAQFLLDRSRRTGSQITKTSSPRAITNHRFIHAANLLQIFPRRNPHRRPNMDRSHPVAITLSRLKIWSLWSLKRPFIIAGAHLTRLHQPVSASEPMQFFRAACWACSACSDERKSSISIQSSFVLNQTTIPPSVSDRHHY